MVEDHGGGNTGRPFRFERRERGAIAEVRERRVRHADFFNPLPAVRRPSSGS
jgi:hypothetical protein